MQCLLDNPSAILAFYKEESSFHNKLYYWDTSGSPIKIFLSFLSLSIWMKQPSLSDKFVWNQPEGLVATISAIHRMEHYPGDEY